MPVTDNFVREPLLKSGRNRFMSERRGFVGIIAGGIMLKPRFATKNLRIYMVIW